MEKQVKKSNLCAEIGFLLTLLNLVISIAFIITGSMYYLLIFASATALLSLVLSVIGKFAVYKTGKGNALSITGIVANVLILATLAVYCGLTTF
ncbi:MAG: hypothetical protein K2N23_06680 [Clostridia bacterium]|nr:hypothetical protein [Clostridia bacterium]